MGELPQSGIGTPCERDEVKSIDALKARVAESNAKLAERLAEDPSSGELLRLTQQDADLGRMTEPEAVSDLKAVEYLLAPRFGVRQEKADGSTKIRPVDHFSWSAAGRSKRQQKPDSINGHTSVAEHIRHDTLDELWAAMCTFVKYVGESPGLVKADVDSAYRQDQIEV